jgi:hypothetical protein
MTMADARTDRLNAARKVPGSHAGPHGSFPITDAKSVNSAMRLAGHAADPAAVRATVKRLAENKGLTGGIPKADKSPNEITRSGGMARVRVGM